MSTAPPSSSSDAFAALPADPAGLPPSAAEPAGWLHRLFTLENLLRFAIVGLAVFLRTFWLDQRPPHFDEGVNGWFTDQMQGQGFYRYDPSNYHGPLHFYVLFLFKTLLGRNLWALRLPVALVGILTVDWCFRFKPFFGRRVAALAALAFALSPGEMFFHRDAIHETWLVFFLVLAFWGLCGLWQLGGRSHLWALGLGVTGMVLTKETYVVHAACLLAALPVLWLLEEYLPSTRRPLLAPYSPPILEPGVTTLWGHDIQQPRFYDGLLATFAPQRYRASTVFTVFGVCLFLIVFFYSGNFFHWSGLEGLVSTFNFWGRKAHEGEGHNKEFIYWTRLLVLNEPVGTVGLLACLRYVVPPLPTARYRWLGVGAVIVCLLVAVGWFWPGHAFDGFHHTLDPAQAARDAGKALTADQAELLAKRATRLEWSVGILVGLGLLAGVSALALPRPADWRLRLLAIYAPGTFLAYSLIPYKTPWCAVSFIWPFFFAAAAVLVEFVDRHAAPLPRIAAWTAAGLLTVLTAWWMVDLNYRRPTNEHFSAAAGFLALDLRTISDASDDLAYVYVQTYDDMWIITDPLLALAKDDPSQYHLRGVILCGSTYPLPWMFGDFTKIGYYSDNNAPADYRADFLLVTQHRLAETESHLEEDYFKEAVHLRPAQEELTLYLRAALFSPYYPNRAAEFHPAPKPPGDPAAVPAETPPPPATEDESTSDDGPG